MMLKPALANLTAAASLGAIVGIVKLSIADAPISAVPLPARRRRSRIGIGLLGCALQLVRSAYPRTDSPFSDIFAGSDVNTRHGGTGVWRHGQRIEPIRSLPASCSLCRWRSARCRGLARRRWPGESR